MKKTTLLDPLLEVVPGKKYWDREGKETSLANCKDVVLAHYYCELVERCHQVFEAFGIEDKS